MKYRYYVILLLTLVILVSISGCASKSPEEAAETSVISFLNAVNEGENGVAFDMYRGKDFLVPASITMIFGNKGIEQGGVKGITIVSNEVAGPVAIIKAECSVSILDLMGKEKDAKVVPIYFRVQDTDLGWIITRVSFDYPLEIDDAEIVDVEVEKTPVDMIADNALLIGVVSFAMLGSGVYLDKKDNAKKKEKSRTIDVLNATPLQKEVIMQYVKIMPPQQTTVGSKTAIDVWVKNSAQQPYRNFAVKAKFGNTVDVKTVNLFFETIAPGETAKRTWIIKPKVSGWVAIEEPTVVFEYAYTKYIGVLDPVWVQVQ
ncbi:hypothetical protein V7O66_01715 [Methanolobus sp. ZRKC3]|uniref:hypothetical protein n=1 Tax=Methanolobus sp. ZRKC3 TaxID=3125786 RepID=UPI00324CCD84